MYYDNFRVTYVDYSFGQQMAVSEVASYWLRVSQDQIFQRELFCYPTERNVCLVWIVLTAVALYYCLQITQTYS